MLWLEFILNTFLVVADACGRVNNKGPFGGAPLRASAPGADGAAARKFRAAETVLPSSAYFEELVDPRTGP